MGGREAAATEHRVFPEASPKNTVGTLQRNTIGTLNQCSEPAFRDQLSSGGGSFGFLGALWGRDRSGAELRLEKSRWMAGSASESVTLCEEKLEPPIEPTPTPGGL